MGFGWIGGLTLRMFGRVAAKVLSLGASKSSRHSKGSLEKVVERDVVFDVSLKSDTLKSSSKPLESENLNIKVMSLTDKLSSHLSACDIAPKL